jgi:hypothetical protein
MLVLSRALLPRVPCPILHYVLSGCASAVVGGGTEFIQYFTPREASLLDMLYNVIGIVSFLGCAVTFDLALRHHAPLRTLFRRNLLRLACLIVFATAFLSFGTVALAHAHREAQFPVICDFETIWDRSFIISSGGKIEFTPPPSAWSANHSHGVCCWSVKKGQGAAITVQYPYPVWSGYRNFLIDIFSAQVTENKVFLRINDIRHNFKYSDRFNTTLLIQPGPNHFTIPLTEVETAPAGRVMDMTGIANIIIFVDSGTPELTLFLDNIRLE